MKENIILILVIGAAVICLTIGILFPFVGLRVLQSNYDNPEYISALFSLSGTLLFSAALIYQIREYKLQLEELKKSVEAQGRSSGALEEQKMLLLEQNTNDLIFKMIDRFNEFKGQDQVQESIKNAYNKACNAFNSVCAGITTAGIARSEFNKQLALRIKTTFSETIRKDVNIYFIKKFIQFAYNIFYLINQKKIPDQKDWFSPFLHIYLSKEESLILHLSNLVDYGMPISDGPRWHYALTLELIEMMNPTKGRDAHKLIDPSMLTEELNSIKQKM